MDKSKHEYLLEEAARWTARLAAPDCTDFERRRCEQWLAAASLNRAAFDEVQATAERIEASISFDARLQSMAEKAFAAGADLADDPADVESNARVEPVRVEFRSTQRSAQFKPKRRFAAAAGIAGVMVIAWTMLNVNDAHHSRDSSAIVIEAPVRSARHATLEDGTRVHVDAGGRLRVTFSNSERRIELESGRAFFEVAHDISRPFSVTANGTRTVALGTKFEVRRGAIETVVTLAEGSVAVSGTASGAAWQKRLHPGEQLGVTGTRPVELRKVDAQEITSWTRGWLVFRGTPLADALHEINRYSAKQVVTADDSLLALNVAGSFVAGDAQSIVDAIAEVLPIRVVDGGNREIILFKRYDN